MINGKQEVAACSELAKFVSLRSCRVPCSLSGLGKPFLQVEYNDYLCSFIVSRSAIEIPCIGLRKRLTKRKAKLVST